MITVLSGGTGTPKFLQGLKSVYDSSKINIIVNTLENNYFSGVYVAPDIDTVLYTMSNMINDETWYGVNGDTFITNERLNELGTPELLKIGDIDRATKIQKTLLMENHTLEEAVNIQKSQMKIKSSIIPMSNNASNVKILTDIGELDFHEFLIEKKGEPNVYGLHFDEVEPSNNLISSIEESDGIIIGPSNPISSILPIISIKGVKKALKNSYVIAISPFIGKEVFSGPAAKFMNALGYESSSIGVGEIYKDFLDVLYIDNKDQNIKKDLEKIINEVNVSNIYFKNFNDKENLAKEILNKIFNKY
ncbi:2-phospho-L-lactate transferase [Methanobrevibacter sp. DSM 116169]|uniref:2-phospho-L-lactate transferase n=1 Tax=Methanobrevibacter sp. DSM 116169 TaxID=3242727 RepID=UPI0038FC3416